MTSNKGKKKIRIIVAVSAALGFVFIGIRLANRMVVPRGLAEIDSQQLTDCPDKANCISSTATRSQHHVESIPFRAESSLAEVKQDLERLLQEIPRSRLVAQRQNYFHVEIRSLIFGFVDDLELLIDEDLRTIGVRSASRVGYSDLGVNRGRVEALRERYEQL